MKDNINPFNRLRAYVVDDDPTMIELVVSILHAMGMRRIERANDGDRAWELFQQGPRMFDFIVCDWSMPNMSGLEFLKHVRELNPDIPFLMLTGKSSTEDVKSALKAGVTQYLAKPFTPDGLQKRIRAMTKDLVG
ncbi:MAG: response regulator [Rhodospirillales bacterium]|nr:response regulator [Rhodospirillales bacterium]